MKPKAIKPPSDLGPAGRDLWRSIEKSYCIDGTEPVLHEFCRVADRLQEIRDAYVSGGGAKGPNAEKLIGSETKMLNQWRQLARSLGLNLPSEKPAHPGLRVK